MDYVGIISSSKAFVEDNCNLGVEEWHAQKDWQRRAPAFLLIGAKKCGTTSLFHYLVEHPDIAKPRSKELLTFIPFRFRHESDPLYYDSKVLLVEAARQDMYDNDYPVVTISMLGTQQRQLVRSMRTSELQSVMTGVCRGRMLPMASGVPSVCHWEVILSGVMFWRAMLMRLIANLTK